MPYSKEDLIERFNHIWKYEHSFDFEIIDAFMRGYDMAKSEMFDDLKGIK